MAGIEIPSTCEFDVGTDKITFVTQINGDKITIWGVHLGAAAAASLTYLINQTQNHLSVEIKEKTP